MWHAIAILLIGAQDPTIFAADGLAPNSPQAGSRPEMVGVPHSPPLPGPPGFEAGLAPGEQPAYSSDFNAGGYEEAYCGPAGSMGRTCFFDTYWDVSGQRSPCDYSGAFAYGPDWCHTWQTRVEWLLWFSRGRNVPPLVTSSDAGTPRAAAGVLGLSTTTTIYGNDPIGEDMRNGVRIALGRVLADDITTVTGRFWGVENGAETVAGNSGNKPIIARPFFNVTTNAQDALLVAFPGVTTPGSMHVLSRNNLFGGEAYVSRNVLHDLRFSLDLLGGYQFTRLDDSILISTTSTSVDPNAVVPVGTQIGLFDQFRTQNEFHGANIGFLADFRKEWLSCEVLGKIAFGDVRQEVVINGQTTLTPPVGAASTSNNGLYALPSNSGSYERHRFAVAPELNINGVWHISPQCRAVVGYSILYWSNVVLAGNQIDTDLNLTQLPGPIVGGAVPAFRFARTDFLVQGINMGLDYRW